MARGETFLLFAPPEPPLRLERGEEAVIGRSRDCDLRLRSGEASRRHAAVRQDRRGAVVRDLGSTNGTFVNGVRIEGRHRLAPGDRIEIGDAVVTFCRVEGESDPAFPTDEHEAQTMVFERPALAPEALAGDLAQIPLFAVLQILEMGSQTGVLEVRGDDGTGRLWMVDGAPVHAETEKAEGFDAALALATTQRGRFDFAPGEATATRSFDVSTTGLVLEASRLLDEAEANG